MFLLLRDLGRLFVMIVTRSFGGLALDAFTVRIIASVISINSFTMVKAFGSIVFHLLSSLIIAQHFYLWYVFI